MQLYPESRTPRLDGARFSSPGAEYRGAPFWCWNCRVDPGVLEEQIESLRRMGFGGFHIHARVGLDTPYLGPEFMRDVRRSDELAIQKGMRCWLYDEDRFPSGFAGGLVTSDVRFRARRLLLTRAPGREYLPGRGEFERCVAAGEKPLGYYLASYRVRLEHGCLAGFARVPRDGGAEEGELWNAFLVLSLEDPYYNNQTYVDVLNPAAIRRFLEVTYERYAQEVGEEFGRSIPGIFTDEPQLSRKWTLPSADSQAEVSIPFTDDFPEFYRGQCGLDLMENLPELFWQLPGGRASTVRWRFHDLMAERFARSYMDPIAAWCGAHGLYATGHYMSERTLFSQTIRLGDCMRLYRNYQLPGIDILCDDKEFSTAKQAQSAAHQYGREGVLCEMYGVTNWYEDFKGHKLQGDWLAALGVTVRVPHLAWMTMAGEGKRDWPASIGFQSPWYREYPLIEDHFARLNTVLTRGSAVVHTAVVHPVESFWLMFGPNDQTGEERADYDAQFENLISWLLYGLTDFDFLCESLMPGQQNGDPRAVGCMRYDAVVVPDCRTLRRSTLDFLRRFAAAGGRVIFAGGVPALLDAQPSAEPAVFAEGCERIPLQRHALLAALEPEREVEVRRPDGRLSDNLFCQLRQDGGVRWLFLCHVERQDDRPDAAEPYRIRLRGCWDVTLFDTLTGEQRPLEAARENGCTVLERTLYAEDSLLLRLEPAAKDAPAPAPETDETAVSAGAACLLLHLPEPESYALAEPNVLLLDTAAFSFDGAPLCPPEDLLRIDDRFRTELGWPLRGEHVAQPWLFPDEEPDPHRLELRFVIESEVAVQGAQLALEQPQNAEITLNGIPAAGVPSGFYVDPQICTLPLPALRPGQNELVVRLRFCHKTNVENLYLLGDFGVRTAGCHACLCAKPEKLVFGDAAAQGLPFYGGNLALKSRIVLKSPAADAVLEVPHFGAPVLTADVDGVRRGRIAFAPHRLRLGPLSAGVHTVTLHAFGDRYNTFGQLHNANEHFKWYGPMSFRTVGAEWTPSWKLRPRGVYDAPLLRLYPEKDLKESECEP